MDPFEGKYDDLQVYIETGAEGNLPEQLIEYVNLIELIRGMHMRYHDRSAIVKFLQQPPYQLSMYQANQRYVETINFFYASHEIKKDAWRNIYADDLDRAANLVLKTATCAKDIDIYKNIKYAAKEMRGLDEKDAIDIPDDFFKKQVKVFTLDPKLVGKPRPDKRLLAKHIDELNIPEADKTRARGDALIETVEFLPIDEQED